MNLTRACAILALSLGATFVASAAPAFAQGGGGDVRAAGHCSAGSTWTLKAKGDDGRIRLEMEVDSNRGGQPWRVGITDDKVRVFSGTRVTKAPSGSFSVELRTANRAGADAFIGTARNTRTAELCVAHVRL